MRHFDGDETPQLFVVGQVDDAKAALAEDAFPDSDRHVAAVERQHRLPRLAETGLSGWGHSWAVPVRCMHSSFVTTAGL